MESDDDRTGWGLVALAAGLTGGAILLGKYIQGRSSAEASSARARRLRKRRQMMATPNTLKMHFLNVGKGACTIVEHPSGRLTMVDIDRSRISEDEEVLTDPLVYYDEQFAGQSLFRFILTHPDMDHMSGLDRLARKVSIENFWDTEHKKAMNPKDWDNSPYDKKDWDRYLAFQRSGSEPKCGRRLRGATGDFWTEDGITILSPSQALLDLADETEDYNHLSYVLMVEHAGVRVLLGGDASCEAWSNILDNVGKEGLKADIFFAPHHGSPNSVNEEVFKFIAPEFVIVSVGEGVDYDYSYYKGLAKRAVYSTKHSGTIQLAVQADGTYRLYR